MLTTTGRAAASNPPDAAPFHSQRWQVRSWHSTPSNSTNSSNSNRSPASAWNSASATAASSSSGRSSSGSSSSSSGRIVSPHTLPPIALDVEYTHICMPDGKHASFAAWVCIVSPDTSTPLLKAYCRHPILNPPQPSPTAPRPQTPPQILRSVGGVRMASLHGAMPLADAAARVTALWHGKLLVGHGLLKDLAALGLDHATRPDALQLYDTVTFPKFQGKGGTARSLRRLAKDILGENIQPSGHLHDPEQDARAVLRLYTDHARSHLLDNYDDLVQHYMQEYMGRASGVQDMGEEEL